MLIIRILRLIRPRPRAGDTRSAAELWQRQLRLNQQRQLRFGVQLGMQPGILWRRRN